MKEQSVRDNIYTLSAKENVVRGNILHCTEINQNQNKSMETTDGMEQKTHIIKDPVLYSRVR